MKFILFFVGKVSNGGRGSFNIFCRIFWIGLLIVKEIIWNCLSVLLLWFNRFICIGSFVVLFI